MNKGMAMRTLYAQVDPLWTHLRDEIEEDIKARQDKSDVNNAKRDANQEKRRADMKAYNEMMERREAERKAHEEKVMA
jgi:hypothetical protein